LVVEAVAVKVEQIITTAQALVTQVVEVLVE
jgi:hypothetical protein